jgi:hypothetical protein
MGLEAYHGMLLSDKVGGLQFSQKWRLDKKGRRELLWKSCYQTSETKDADTVLDITDSQYKSGY